MFCTRCGSELRENDRFCSQCAHPTGVGGAAPRLQKRLMRDMQNKKIAGVCSGVAEYLGVDITLMRVLWAAMFLIGGVGLLAYIVLWIVMPKAPLALPGPGYVGQTV
jgi:phage shock protein C